MKRREFLIRLGISGFAIGSLNMPGGCDVQQENNRFINTVRGRLSTSSMGFTLPHEHIMVDFEEAEKTGPHRYDVNEVFRIMGPYVEEVSGRGVNTFIECTPNFLGRDVGLLQRLAVEYHINIVTNTGLYKEPHLPSYAFEESEEQLAERWVSEVENGIDGSDVKAGFVKIAVHPEPLKPVQRKIVRAACLTSDKTGVIVACHTAHGPAAMEVLDIFDDMGVPASKYIFVHAQSESDVEYLVSAAERDAWISLDGVGWNNDERIIKHLAVLNEQGFSDQILLSQDRGWYHVGEEEGGEIKPFTYLIDQFIPRLKQEGYSQKWIDEIFIKNPARAFGISA